MMLRIQAERLAGLQLDLEQYKASYQLTGQRLAAHAPSALVLHPGPIIRGLELTAGRGRRRAIGHPRASDATASRFAWPWWSGHWQTAHTKGGRA